MSTTNKKRRADASGDEGEDDVTLTRAWELLKENGPTTHKNFEEYLKAVKEDDEDITEIMAASYFKAADMENKFYVPSEFSAFTAQRNGKGEVTAIIDPVKGDGVTGIMLKKVLVMGVMREKGMKAIIYGQVDDDTFEALVIPSAVQMVADPPPKATKEFHTEARMLFTPKAGTAVYAPAERILAILSVGYVTISEVGSVTKALNALAQKEDIGGLDDNSLRNTRSIKILLEEEGAKQSRKHFLETMLAAHLKSVSMKDRIALLQSFPTYTMANRLELRLPHGGPCYTKLGNKPIAPKALSTLGPDARILMSTNVMSQKDFNDLRGNVGDYQVYVDDPNLGGRRNNKFVAMNVKFTERNDIITAYMSTISGANEKQGTGGTAAPDTSSKKVSFKDIDLD